MRRFWLYDLSYLITLLHQGAYTMHTAYIILSNRRLLLANVAIHWVTVFFIRNNKIFVILLFILVHFYLFAISFHDLRLWFNFPQYQPCNKIVLIDYCLTCINCDEDKLLGKLGQKGGECQQSDQSYSEAAFFVCSQMGRRRQWCWSSLVEMGKSCFGRIQDWSGLFPHLSLLLCWWLKMGFLKKERLST